MGMAKAHQRLPESSVWQGFLRRNEHIVALPYRLRPRLLPVHEAAGEPHIRQVQAFLKVVYVRRALLWSVGLWIAFLLCTVTMPESEQYAGKLCTNWGVVFESLPERLLRDLCIRYRPDYVRFETNWLAPKA